MLMVSACLCGIACRYDAAAFADGELSRLVREGRAIPVCPECLGGLPTPRTPCEICGGDGDDVLEGRALVMDKNGQDQTAAFIKGAQYTLQAALSVGANQAILKARSPSCGCGCIYDGSFSGILRKGNGVTAALLLRNGIQVTQR